MRFTLTAIHIFVILRNSNAEFYADSSEVACFSQEWIGTKDRTDTQVLLLRRDWLSTELISALIEIVLVELLRYHVVIVTEAPPAYTINEELKLAVAPYDIDAEVWQPLDSEFDFGPIGYIGRSGLYVLNNMLRRNEFVTYYKLYLNASLGEDIGIFSFKDPAFTQLFGSVVSSCDKSKYSWCGSGTLEGYYAPPQSACEAQPLKCLEFLMVNTEWDTGYFEQLTRNLGLQVIHSYVGGSLYDIVQGSQSTSHSPIFYWFEPHPWLWKFNASRIDFPDNKDDGCSDETNHNPNLGTVACDYPAKVLRKAGSPRLRNHAPEAYYFLSKLNILAPDLQWMMQRTVEAGGTMTAHQAACKFLQFHKSHDVAMRPHEAFESLWISHFAPTCMVYPNSHAFVGNLIFDTTTLECKQADIFPNAAPSSCLDRKQHGTVNRRHTTITVPKQSWETQIICTSIIEIILRELLGYTVNIVLPTGITTLLWKQELITGLYDLDPEFWRVDSLEYKNNVPGDELLSFGPIGYAGRSGMYVLPDHAARDIFATYWKTYLNASNAADIGIMTFRDTNLKDIAGDKFPVCNASRVKWCGTGNFTGYWATPQCRSDPASCFEFYMAYPAWDEGWFEQVARNLELKAIFGYYGSSLWKTIEDLAQQKHQKTPVFYAFEPDILPSRVGAVRISFPDYLPGCETGDTKSPYGPISCDYAPKKMVKIGRTWIAKSAKEAQYVLNKVEFDDDLMKQLLAMTHGAGGIHSPEEVACHFMRNNPDWVANVAPDEIARPIPLSELRSGDTWFNPELDPPQVEIIQCADDEVLLTRNAAVVFCKKCDAGSFANQERTACIEVLAADTDTTERLVFALGGAAIGIIILSIVFTWLVHRRRITRQEELDSPSRPETRIGAWTLAWAGKYVQQRLELTSTAASSINLGSEPSLEDDEGSSRCSCCRRCCCRSGDHTSKKQKLSWYVNGSPFGLALNVGSKNRRVLLPANSFLRAKGVHTGKSMRLSLHVSPGSDAEDYMCDMQRLQRSFSEHSFEKADGALSLHCPVLRVELQNDPGADRRGDLKLVYGPKGSLLILWSPPPELRGMPLSDFEMFLQRVTSHPEIWKCTSVDEHGTKSLCEKLPEDKTRNMYDACENMIKWEASAMDASYAELFSDYGRPDLFASHVWSEAACDTLQTMRNVIYDSSFIFDDFGATMSMNSTPTLPHLDAIDTTEKRIWFCTACNNQSRVHEELGNDVNNSPFYRVLASPSCCKVVLFNPLKALTRKWCNYEFSVSMHHGKQVVMATTDGVVQSGRVCPKELHDLATKVGKFRCEDSTCFDPDDAELINEAIQQMGGYSTLDTEIRTVFADAILEAHQWTSRALRRLNLATVNSKLDVGVPNVGVDGDVGSVISLEPLSKQTMEI